MTRREGERVTGAIFPTGARRCPWFSRWAYWSGFWRPVVLCLVIAECRHIGRGMVGRARTGWDA